MTFLLQNSRHMESKNNPFFYSYHIFNIKKQSVKVKGLPGILQLIKSGVPQRSILGPILFNIFINDIHFSLQEDLHNFADDRTVIAIADSLQALIEVLTEKANTATDWFQVE